MRTFKNYRITNESWEEQAKAHRYNPAQVLRLFPSGVKEKRYTIDSGRDDNISVFRDGDMFYVLSINRHLPYVGIQVFDLKCDGDVFNSFLQEDQVEDTLGKDWDNKSEIWIAKVLSTYM
jgi:hypothetical protein